jgi:hypothetical protein
MAEGWALVEGELALNGMPIGWALPDGWKLVEEGRKANRMGHTRRLAIRGRRARARRNATRMVTRAIDSFDGLRVKGELGGLPLGLALLEGEFDGVPMRLSSRARMHVRGLGTEIPVKSLL